MMFYLEHFGLQFPPFERELAPEHLFDLPQFAEALARLLYVCRKRTLAVLTGEPGSGKSTLLRLLRHKLEPESYLFIYLADSQLTPRNFYTLCLSALGLAGSGSLPKLKTLFKTALMDLYENNNRTAVIAVDEAQTLEDSMLQELRFIMNFRVDSFSPLALVLVGESNLKAALRAFHMSAIWRRVDTSYHLTAMDFDQTKAYINHHLRVAGCPRPLFPDDVISRIQDRTKGIPAFVNTLCKGCLLDAGARKQELVDGENLARVLTDFS